MNLKAFPYPVLGRADDFVDSHFQSTIDTAKEATSDGERVIVDYSFLLSSLKIQGLIDDCKATFAIDISCSDTLTREVQMCQNKGALKFEVGQLHGKVMFSPVVVVTDFVTGFHADDFNPEYSGTKFDLSPGDVIAIDDPQVRYIEFDKLQFESLVRVQTSEDIPDESYRFDLDSDIIMIQMGKKFRRLWDMCREDKDKAPFMAMSVYKDCIHAALDFMIRNEDSEEFKWVRALRLKLQTLGTRISQQSDFNDLSTHAQLLVSKFGVQRLLRNA